MFRQTLSKAIASVSATALILGSVIVPGMGVQNAQAAIGHWGYDTCTRLMDEGFSLATDDVCENKLDLPAPRGYTAGVFQHIDFWGSDFADELDAAQQAADLGFLNGEGGDINNLNAFGNTNRASVLQMGMNFFPNLAALGATASFPDTNNGDWFDGPFANAFRAAAVNGIDGMGKPGQDITYAEANALAMQMSYANAVVQYALDNDMELPPREVIAGGSSSYDRAVAFIEGDLNVSTVFDGDTPVVAGDVTARLAAGSPTGRTLAISSAKEEVLRIKFEGTGTVTQVTLQKTSIANVASIAGVVLFRDNLRITDSFSLNSDGLVVIGGLNIVAPAEISVVVTIAGATVATSGEEIRMGMKQFTVKGSSQPVVMSPILEGGTFPLATATIASFTTAVVTPTGGAFNAGPEEQTLFQSTFSFNQRNVKFVSMSYEQIGSANASAFGQLRLLIDGVEVATADGVDPETDLVTFVAKTDSIVIQQGARVIQVVGKLVDEAGRTFQFRLQSGVDVVFIDPTVNAVISSTTAFPISPAAASTINAGSCTTTKKGSSQTGQVVTGATNVTLAEFDVICYGEDVKARTFTAGLVYSNIGGNPTLGLQNGYIAIGMTGDGSSEVGESNPSQQGGNATLLPAGTLYNTNFTFSAGLHYTVAIKADTIAAVGAQLAAGETIQATLNAGVANAERQDSRGTFNLPSAVTNGSTLTAANGALIALTASSNYPSQSTIAPLSGAKIGEGSASNGNVENVNVTSVTVALGFGGGMATTDLSDLVVKFNGKQAPVLSSVGATQTLSVSDVLKTNETVTVEVFVNILGTAPIAGTVTPTVTVNGTTSQSGVAAASAATAFQTFTIANASIAMSAGPNGANAQIMKGNQNIVIFEGDMSTLNDTFTLNGLTITLTNFTTVQSVVIKQGDTVHRTFAPAASTTLTGLEIPAIKNGNTYFKIELVLGSVGTSAGTSGESIQAAVTAATALNSNGTQLAVTLNGTVSQTVNVYKDVPLLVSQSLPANSLTAAADQVMAKWQVTGSIGWTKISFAVNKTGGAGKLSVTGCYVKKISDNSTIPGTCTSTIADTATTGTAVFVATAEQTIPQAGEVYELHMNMAGAPTTGDTFAVTLQNSGLTPAAGANAATVQGTAATFVWTDRSAAPHSLTSTDFYNDAFVKNIPLNWDRYL